MTDVTSTCDLSGGEWALSPPTTPKSKIWTIYTKVGEQADGTPIVRVLAHVFDNDDGRAMHDARAMMAARDLFVSAQAALTMLEDDDELFAEDLERVSASLLDAVHKAKGMKDGN